MALPFLRNYLRITLDGVNYYYYINSKDTNYYLNRTMSNKTQLSGEVTDLELFLKLNHEKQFRKKIQKLIYYCNDRIIEKGMSILKKKFPINSKFEYHSKYGGIQKHIISDYTYNIREKTGYLHSKLTHHKYDAEYCLSEKELRIRKIKFLI